MPGFIHVRDGAAWEEVGLGVKLGPSIAPAELRNWSIFGE